MNKRQKKKFAKNSDSGEPPAARVTVDGIAGAMYVDVSAELTEGCSAPSELPDYEDPAEYAEAVSSTAKAPVEEAPAEEKAAEVSAEEVHAEVKAEETPVEEAPIEEKAAEAPAEEAPAEEKAVEAPAEKAPIEEKAVEAPAEEAHSDETAAEVPAAEAPIEEKTEEAPASEPSAATEKPAPEELKPLRILHVASEASPFIKTGGLADVLGSLPKTQASMGHDVSVILPKYRDIPWRYVEKMEFVTSFTVQLGWRTQYCGVMKLAMDGVTYYFIDNEYYFGFPGVYTEGNFEAERFSFFSRAVLETVGHLALFPDVLHCHDWQSGMVPFLLKTQYSFNPAYWKTTCVYTIHNLRFQGVFSWPLVEGMLFIDYRFNSPDNLEYNGDINFMKGGIVFSDIITTVSPTYAGEIQTEFFGETLEGLLRDRSDKLFGVLNGIDMKEYDPKTDEMIPARYSADDLSGKRICKAALQREIWLAERPEVPLIGMVSRMTSQKGFDLIQRVLCDLLDNNDVQIALLGTGEHEFEDFFRWAANAYPGRVAPRIEMNFPLSHRFYAGCDLFLMPSLFEPCGLSQMMAMRYGTLPIVRETGGLADTVRAYNEFEGTGTGYSFYNYNAHEMLGTIENAINVFNLRPEHHKNMMLEAMACDFSWNASAERYIELYRYRR